MINLLPPAARAKVAHEYQRRLAAISLVMAGALCVIGTGLLFPVYSAVQSRTEAAKAEAALAEATVADPGLKAAALEVERVSALFAAVQQKAASARPSAVIELMTAARGSGVTIRAITYTASGSTIEIVLNGTAATRETLLVFKKALAAVPGVTSADFPSDALVASSTVMFSMRVRYTPPVPAIVQSTIIPS